MRDSYDVVVIGSGYGGGVAASRMARGRQSVCVLEIGKERWPGEFPEELCEAIKEVHISGELAPGDRRGKEGLVLTSRDPTKLYHFIVGNGQNAFVGNGLGGTSLLNANVFLKAHPKVLDMEIWPEELRGHDAWEQCEQLIQCRLRTQVTILMKLTQTTNVRDICCNQSDTQTATPI
jgi:choline dehydrogenase-like flavoprotein